MVNLQQLAAALGGCRDLVWVEAELRAGALVVQQQAVHQRWDEGARRRLACRIATVPLSPDMGSIVLHHWVLHVAACGACVTEQQTVHEGTWRSPIASCQPGLQGLMQRSQV